MATVTRTAEAQVPAEPGVGTESLVVIDRLEVGAAHVERDRLTASYAVTTPTGTSTTELIYKYEEPVFEPGDPQAANLADMIAAQVALNYGLFSREIVFQGVFDKTDRAFLLEMARNTAREIFVKKFLEPNPFLLDEALVARVDLKADRSAGVLVVRGAFAEPGLDPDVVAGPLAVELHRAADWLECDDVLVAERGDLAAALGRAMRAVSSRRE